MRPLNHKKRKISFLQFALVFFILTVTLFSIGYLTLKTGELGVNVLEKKHKLYSDTFRNKAALTYDLEDIIKKFYQITVKDRNLSEHKKFQDLISDVRDRISENVKEEERIDEFIFYEQIILQIKDIQSDLDTYKEDYEAYIRVSDLLERCKEKYIELKEKENN